MGLVRRRCLLLLWALCCARSVLAAEVGVVVSGDERPYREMAEAFTAAMATSGVAVVLRAPGTPGADEALVVAIGSSALEKVLADPGRTPVLSLLVPAASFSALLKAAPVANGRRISAVFLDQPPSRLLALVAEALPERRRVGVLLGEDSLAMLPALNAAARRYGLTVLSSALPAGTDVLATLPDLLQQSDTFLALPDARVANRYTVPPLLLQTYRRRVPVIGFSQSWLTAGAALTLYSTTEQTAAAAAAMVREWVGTGILPGPRYAPQFVVGVNRYVARSLGLNLDDETQIAERLRLRESGS